MGVRLKIHKRPTRIICCALDVNAYNGYIKYGCHSFRTNNSRDILA